VGACPLPLLLLLVLVPAVLAADCHPLLSLCLALLLLQLLLAVGPEGAVGAGMPPSGC
jgi:hypothetical protein